MTSPTTVQVQIQVRADTAANWTATNPVLLANELGRETDTGKFKIGNGSTAWSSLSYQPWSQVSAYPIANADISATAEIAVSKLADGTARQLLQTDAAGTGVEWASNIDVPGTLDVTGAATFDAGVTIQGDLTVNGTTTTIDTQNLIVEDKNVIIGQVATPTDVTADGGGFTLKGSTDKTINWVDATDAWTFSEHVNLASGKGYYINGTEVLSSSTLGSGVTGSSLTSVGTIGTGVWQGTAINKTYLDSTLVSTGDTGTVTSTMILDGTIVNADINASAEIAVSKLADGAARQLLQTDAAGTGVEWTDNVDIPGTLDVTSTATFDSIASFALGTAGAPTITFTGDTNTGIYSPGADQVAIGTGGTERARIDSSGRLLVGTSTTVGANRTLQVAGTGAEFFYNAADNDAPPIILSKSRGSLGSPSIVSSGDYTGFIRFRGFDGSGYIDTARIESVVDGTPGTNDMPGRLVFSTTADGASSPTERMRITSAGSLCVGNANPNANTTGFRADATGRTDVIVSSATVAAFNRTTSDGTIISLRQDDNEEGTISVSGTTVSYNGAHLSRWSQLPGGAERTEVLRGTVLSNIDEMCEWGEEDNEQLNRMKVSDIEGDPNVSGVFQSWDDDDDTYTDDFYCAMTGDFIIRIAEGVTVQRGDLLMSAGDGTAKPQDDDIIRSKTVAKVTSTHVTCTYDDGSYCVPCVLMAC